MSPKLGLSFLEMLNLSKGTRHAETQQEQEGIRRKYRCSHHMTPHITIRRQWMTTTTRTPGTQAVYLSHRGAQIPVD